MSAIEILKKLSEKYYGDANSEIMGAIAEVKAKDEEIERLKAELEYYKKLSKSNATIGELFLDL